MKNIFFLIFILATMAVTAQEKVYAPSLTSPINAATNQLVNMTFDWNPVAGAVKYQLHFDTSATFSNPFAVVTPYSAWQSSLMIFGATYFWRVRAIDASSDTSSWSSVRSFGVVNKPTLTFPKDSSKVVPVSNLLGWSLMSGVGAYQIQYDSVNTFDSPFLKTGVTGATNIFRTVDNYYGDQYFWRVRGINGLDTSDWSLTRTLWTADTVAIVSPLNGATNLHPVDSITILSFHGTNGYLFAFDTDAGFSDPIYFMWDSTAMKVTGGDTIARKGMDTIPFGDFFWKVCLINNVDTSSWSVAHTLSTIDKVAMTSPLDGAIDVPVTTTFEWTAIRGSKYYILEYDTSSIFSNPTVVNVNGLSYDPTSNLLSQTDYYWRVRSVTVSDTTNVWNEYNFKTYFGVGINEDNLASWSVYPNPTTGVFNINLESATNARMEILNVLGDVVYSRNNLVNGINTISIEKLNSGFYMLRLYIGGDTYTSRIIKN